MVLRLTLWWSSTFVGSSPFCMPAGFVVFAVGTGVVVMVVAVVLVVLLVTVSMQGRQMRGAQRRGETRRDLDQAQARAEHERDPARDSGEDPDTAP